MQTWSCRVKNIKRRSFMIIAETEQLYPRILCSTSFLLRAQFSFWSTCNKLLSGRPDILGSLLERIFKSAENACQDFIITSVICNDSKGNEVKFIRDSDLYEFFEHCFLQDVCILQNDYGSEYKYMSATITLKSYGEGDCSCVHTEDLFSLWTVQPSYIGVQELMLNCPEIWENLLSDIRWYSKTSDKKHMEFIIPAIDFFGYSEILQIYFPCVYAEDTFSLYVEAHSFMDVILFSNSNHDIWEKLLSSIRLQCYSDKHLEYLISTVDCSCKCIEIVPLGTTTGTNRPFSNSVYSRTTFSEPWKTISRFQRVSPTLMPQSP